MGYKIIMKFVLALLAVAAATDCTGVEDDKLVPDGCDELDCTDKDKPYKGCKDIPCTDSADKPLETPYKGCKADTCTKKDKPYKGCEVPECKLDDKEYDKDDPYEGCTIPSCKGAEYVEADDEGKNCVPNDPGYCDWDEEAGTFKVDEPKKGCADPCKDREEDDKPEYCNTGSNTGLIIVLVLAAVGGLAGAFYCKHQKKACFKEKPEGGKFESLI